MLLALFSALESNCIWDNIYNERLRGNKKNWRIKLYMVDIFWSKFGVLEDGLLTI